MINIVNSGYFYNCFNDDALIMNYLFNYKLIYTKKYIKVVFPSSNIKNIIDRLNYLSISYLLNDINYKFIPNNYSEYLKISKENEGIRKDIIVTIHNKLKTLTTEELISISKKI